jgi:CheY-like chemotaxis protein
VDLNVRLEELLPLIQHTMGGSIEVVVDLDDNPMVHVDSSGLAAAILNLAINARDAMPDGGRLTLRTRVRSILYDDAGNDLPPGAYVALSVTDTGVGMSHDVLNRAADPFFTTKPQGRGTGLGLAMAKGFAKQSAGEFRIYSELGHGTSITFLLPLTSRAERATLRISAPRGGDERVLVVDDELELLAVTATWLKDLGYDVTPCASARSALAAVADAARDARPFTLLVTDIIMPGMNGFALATACRAQVPSLRVLYVSGFADAAERTSDHLEGELLQKPFRQIELAIAARRALDDDAVGRERQGGVAA